jgi:hypothetical protein
MAKRPRGPLVDRQRRSARPCALSDDGLFYEIRVTKSTYIYECEREDCPATQCRAQSKVLPLMLPVATAGCIETWSVRILRDARRHGSACCDTGRCVHYAMAAPAGVAALRLVTGNTFLEISNSSASNSRRRYCNNVSLRPSRTA